MAVLQATRVARPSWANLRTALGLLLFCGALLAGQQVLESNRATVEVWIAARDIPANTTIEPSDVRAAEVQLSPELLDRYARSEAPIAGALLTRPTLEGELFANTALANGGSVGAGRSMTIPVEPEHAVGGDLRVGQRVDVFGTFDVGRPTAETGVLVRGVEIIDLVKAGGLVVGEQSVVGVTVAVSPEDASRLAFSVRNGEIDIVRVDGPTDAQTDLTVRSGDVP